MECKRPICSNTVASAVTALIPTLRQTRANSVNMFFFFSFCTTVYNVSSYACMKLYVQLYINVVGWGMNPRDINMNVYV